MVGANGSDKASGAAAINQPAPLSACRYCGGFCSLHGMVTQAIGHRHIAARWHAHVSANAMPTCDMVKQASGAAAINQPAPLSARRYCGGFCSLRGMVTQAIGHRHIAARWHAHVSANAMPTCDMVKQASGAAAINQPAPLSARRYCGGFCSLRGMVTQAIGHRHIAVRWHAHVSANAMPTCDMVKQASGAAAIRHKVQ